MWTNRTIRLLPLMAAACWTAGCSDAPALKRSVVAGSVTLQGKPVEDGQIRYVPIEGTAGPITMARIVQGRYQCDDKGGVPVGKHRVEIQAWDPKLPPGGRGEPTRPPLVPSRFNEKSELVETVRDDGPVEMNFSL